MELPFRIGDVENESSALPLVRATLRSQVGVTHPAPPYFEFGAFDDPLLDLNVRCVRLARRLRPGRQLAVFVRGSLDGLVSGALAASALRYASAVPEGGLAVLGVSGLHPDTATPEMLAAYLGAVEAFDAAGFDVVADRVDRFCSAAVAYGAIGGTGGTRVYRTIPPGPFWENEYTVKIRVKYAVPVRGDSMKPDDARRRRVRASIEKCPVQDCEALAEGASNADLRRHHGHLLQHEMADAQLKGKVWLAARYEESPLGRVRSWGEAMRLAMLRRERA